jgi:hypothetical protein
LFCAADGTAPTDGYVSRTVKVIVQVALAASESLPASSRVSAPPLNAPFAAQPPAVTAGAVWIAIVGDPVVNVFGR